MSKQEQNERNNEINEGERNMENVTCTWIEMEKREVNDECELKSRKKDERNW